MSELVLIVEDEPKIAQSISDYLSYCGYTTHMISNGDEVISWVKAHSPSVVLLDLMLPGKDGLAICQELRSFSQIPVIMLTAKRKKFDRLLGLEIGADDYICKPFSLEELAARIKAVLRRYQHNPSVEETKLELELNKGNNSANYEGNSVELTAIELNMLERLTRRPGTIFGRSDLMDVAYVDGRIVNDRTVDSHIRKVREKLKLIAPDKQFIHSIYGIGYKFEP